MKKITAFIVTLMLTVSMMAAFVSADDASIKVKFRIEGVSGNIYYDTFETTSTTLTDVLKELDAASDDITMTITEIICHHSTESMRDHMATCQAGCSWLTKLNRMLVWMA